MVGIKKMSHGGYSTPDLVEQTEYYTDVLGLTVTGQEKGKVYLSSTVDHHSVILEQGSDAACVQIGFQIGPDADLDAVEAHVNALDIKTERKTDAQPTISDMLVFDDFKGTRMEIFRRPESQGLAFGDKGIVPHKLGHIAFHVDDVQKATDYYCKVLGFRVSDWMGDFFSFLRCGTDHHTINLIGTGVNKHHHSAFELRDWAHIQQACDILCRKGYKLIWGPGRHGIGHNLFTYHAAPNGLTVELFAFRPFRKIP